jgi:hypothetical protein
MNLPTKVALAGALILSACTMGGGPSAGARKGATGGTSTTTSTSTSTSTATGTATPGVPRSVTVSWTANRERAVNAAGGGYRVYYSNTMNFSLGSATAVSAAYVSGSAAPTSVTIPSLTSGTYYYRVVAYSGLNPSGSQSDQFSFVVP